MTANPIRNRWSAGETVLDCWVSGSSVLSTEVIGRLGFDSIVIDMQHTMAEYRDVVTSIIALTATPTVPLVRVPGNDPLLIGRVLDAGARGVMSPMINNRAEAERFVGACRYSPEGTRSFGPYRAYDGLRRLLREREHRHRDVRADRDGGGDVQPRRHRRDPRTRRPVRGTR